MREKPIETIEYKGYNIDIYSDDDPFQLNPVEDWDMIGKMVCWHNRYNLGHEQPKYNSEDYLQELAIEADPSLESKIDYWENGNGWKQVYKHTHSIENASKFVTKRIKDLIQKTIDKHYIMLDIHMYDHSGITINTTGFNCMWDSGQIGFIYVSKKDAKKEWNWKVLTKKRIKSIYEILKAEVKVYDQYLRGDIYGYNIDDPITEESIDSCYGFYGHDFDENGLIDQAKSIIDNHIKNENIIKTEAYAIEIGSMEGMEV